MNISSEYFTMMSNSFVMIDSFILIYIIFMSNTIYFFG